MTVASERAAGGGGTDHATDQLIFNPHKGDFWVMANFTVRVELHQAELVDYQRLHVAMEQKGFSRQITADDGRAYYMPWAEYNGSGNLTSAQVRDIARQAADSTGKQNAVFVTEAVSRAWIGLNQLTTA
jgi:hypothetical protein